MILISVPVIYLIIYQKSTVWYQDYDNCKQFQKRIPYYLYMQTFFFIIQTFSYQNIQKISCHSYSSYLLPNYYLFQQQDHQIKTIKTQKLLNNKITQSTLYKQASYKIVITNYMSASKRCYYQVLSLQRTASNDQIKKSFRKLAVKWHPDKNQDNKEEASEKFKQLSEAYECLTDEAKRKQYDLYGHEGPRKASSQAYSYTRADDLFKSFFSQFGFQSASDQQVFGRRYGAKTFSRGDYGNMGSNYQDILRNLGKGTSTGGTSYSRAGSYGGSGYSSFGSTGKTTGGTTSGGYGASYGTSTGGGRTYVRVNSTAGGYGYGGSFGGSGTVIGGEQEGNSKQNLRNKWANRFQQPQQNQQQTSQTQDVKSDKPSSKSNQTTYSTSSMNEDGTQKIETKVSIKNGVKVTTTKTTCRNSDGSRNVSEEVVEQGVSGKTIRRYTLPAGCPDLDL